jgi:hypothetical protein
MNPRHYLLLLPIVAFALVATPGCNDNDGPVEKIGKEIDDALDARPNEGIKDAIENAADKVDRAVN